MKFVCGFTIKSFEIHIFFLVGFYLIEPKLFHIYLYKTNAVFHYDSDFHLVEKLYVINLLWVIYYDINTLEP